MSTEPEEIETCLSCGKVDCDCDELTMALMEREQDITEDDK